MPKEVPASPTLVARGAAFSLDVWQNAVVLVDKPQGWTSFDVCHKLRNALTARNADGTKARLKVGHAGTLDPLATGLLIICVGKATKQIDAYVAADKEYTGTLRLGQATATYDAEVEPCEELPWEHLTDEDLERARERFLGAIQQRPPMFSAVKVDGERLYFKARRGEVMEVKTREVTIAALELSREAGSRDVDFRVACSKGTYVRSLVNDLGRTAGTAAYMLALRRERIGQHSVAAAWPLSELVAAAEAARDAEAQRQGLHAAPPPPGRLVLEKAELVPRGSGACKADWNRAKVLVDKLPGERAADVCARLRTITRGKVWFANQLPDASSGLLLLCFGRAEGQRDINAMSDSTISGVLRLGGGAGEAASSAEQPCDVRDDALEAARQKLLGTIQQRVAERQGGGEAGEPRKQTVRIRRLDLSREGRSSDIAFNIMCSKGTDVDMVLHDLAKAAGCTGHVAMWRRERLGAYSVTDAWPTEEL
ncbi:hypothetical protein WJX81_004352 [Elliptochloris bilobata]|uniref:tRNA pseudouridine(55) synthase n=1 Tax=Elliptochloris bilobata TaxID=381761 RepID=A0AAW1SDP9_9CHLO